MAHLLSADLIAEKNIIVSPAKAPKNDVPIVSEENTQSHAIKHARKSFFS